MGFPAASLEEFKLTFGYWGVFPFYFKNEFIVGRYGDVKMTDIFLLEKEPFPIEPVTDNIVNTFSAYYFLSPLILFNTKIFYYKDENHYSNRINQFKGFAAQVGIELFVSGGLDL